MGRLLKKVRGRKLEPFVQLPMPSLYRDHDLYKGARYWSDGTYDVIEIVAYSHEVTWLSIKRRDKEWIHDWRDLQRIKNEICGPEREAFEIYPAESRMNDTANQYHMWVLAPGMLMPVGYTDRAVIDGTVPDDPFNMPGQRPLPEGTKTTDENGATHMEMWDGKLSRAIKVRCRVCWQMVPASPPVDVVACARAVIEEADPDDDLPADGPLWTAIGELERALDGVQIVSRETSKGVDR